ncbi:hypothetical protein HHI36_000890 [Cryptolaemus montrouzieri]|uniref:Uncharacterized protein n=1 Tax=Cryptolaemus montrouzieri TaxID=559131 RepID=A0ABD2P675_9CUCU
MYKSFISVQAYRPNHDRQEQKNNIMLYGFREQTTHVPRKQRIAQENDQVNEIIRNIEPDASFQDIKTRRLGKFNAASDRPRPIKITLSNSHEIRDILKVSKRLKDWPLYSYVSLSSDKTPRQQKFFNNVKLELSRQKAEGMLV